MAGTGEAVALLVGILTAITLTFGLVGTAVKFALLPWLKDQVVKPVQETHKQLTVNSYKSQELTFLDRFDLMNNRMQRIEDRVEAIETKVDNDG